MEASVVSVPYHYSISRDKDVSWSQSGRCAIDRRRAMGFYYAQKHQCRRCEDRCCEDSAVLCCSYQNNATGRISGNTVSPPINTLPPCLCLHAPPRNGKVDRTALQKRALEHSAASAMVDSEGQYPIITPKKSETHLVASTWADIPPVLTIALPVYQREARPRDISAAHTGSPQWSAAEVSTPSINTRTNSLEKVEHLWSGYEEDVLPEKTQPKILRNIRHQVFSLYRRLFGVVFVTNAAILIAVLVRGANSQQLGEIIVANLFCAILMRQDYVINAFFTVFCAVPTS